MSQRLARSVHIESGGRQKSAPHGGSRSATRLGSATAAPPALSPVAGGERDVTTSAVLGIASNGGTLSRVRERAGVRVARLRGESVEHRGITR
jgi:hypothetical protein